MPPVTDNYRSPQLLLFRYALERGWQGSYEAQPADDVYALGVTAYRLLAGCYPPSDSGADGSTPVVPPEAPRGLKETCPELGEIIAQMLSHDDPEARGTAKEVAEELEALLEYARPALDEPWQADASRQPTAKTEPPTPREPALPSVSRAPAPPPVAGEHAGKERVPLLFLAGNCLVLALLCVLLTRGVERREVASTEPESELHVPEKPDAGTAVGEEGLASVAPAETTQGSEGRISRELPDQPSKDQKRPPCTQREAVEINGGCWRLAVKGADTAPCDSDLYEHAGRCYSAILKPVERVPNSEEPQ